MRLHKCLQLFGDEAVQCCAPPNHLFMQKIALKATSSWGAARLGQGHCPPERALTTGPSRSLERSTLGKQEISIGPDS